MERLQNGECQAGLPFPSVQADTAHLMFPRVTEHVVVKGTATCA